MLCDLCPNACNVDRSFFKGACGETNEIRIARYGLHPFEEPVISTNAGAGAVFFCGCSLKCAFCQNYELSRSERGTKITPQELAEIFKKLESSGATTIDLVSPTHFADGIVKAFEIYKPKIPVVYNTHGYETIKTLELVDPFVDVYLPDVKFFSPERAARYCKKTDYFEKCFNALKFMIDSKPCVEENGLLLKGVIVRHLVLPQNVDETVKILSAIRPIMKDAYLSLMSQYTPFGDIEDLPELKRRLTRREYVRAKKTAMELAFEKVFTQDYSSADESFIPVWDL